MTNAEIRRIHGDSTKFPISMWRKEFDTGQTTLNYVDWRADKKSSAYWGSVK